ncbi:uracil-DNA glycosylase [Xanthovirga aplysinae]|uniref:uracil-DNA glycosylase n=1 Tax=Xanthovirga aplysinae TaxID=2529853 RepID=UPI0012BC63AE|nr:uracil-DNA glycosylase [Xanthovirga aplysinae]MTI29978.1 uracil-DNA glycosylase [Xanthovirga aplysinae]
MILIHESSWKKVMQDEFGKPYFKKLSEFVEKEYENETIYPIRQDIFKAFESCPFNKLKVVLIGQDPYHGPGQANGLCFSVNDGIKKPPSLQNIFKELQSDLNTEIRESGCLQRWADQGVLLLNATLTVAAQSPGAHQNKGWEEFTDQVIQRISDLKEHVVFILWGAYAQKKGRKINEGKHLVIKSAHPSPLSARRGFFGSKPFSNTNAFLKSYGKEEIKW